MNLTFKQKIAWWLWRHELRPRNKMMLCPVCGSRLTGHGFGDYPEGLDLNPHRKYGYFTCTRQYCDFNKGNRCRG